MRLRSRFVAVLSALGLSLVLANASAQGGGGNAPMIDARDSVEPLESINSAMYTGTDEGEDPRDPDNAPGVGNGPGEIPLPAAITECPESLVIFVHGYNNDAADAQAGTNAVAGALAANGYGGTVVGFSWNGDVDFEAAEQSANLNGKILANVLLEIKEICPDTKLHLIGHSLGARVIMVALACGGCACSTQVVAPAVRYCVLNDPQCGGEFGGGLLDNTHSFKIWYNPEDNALFWFKFLKGFCALGDIGTPNDHGGRVRNCCHQTKISDEDDHGIGDLLTGGTLAACLAGHINQADAEAAEAAQGEGEGGEGEGEGGGEGGEDE